VYAVGRGISFPVKQRMRRGVTLIQNLGAIMIFSEACNTCGLSMLCEGCETDYRKVNISSGEDVCLSLNEDGSYYEIDTTNKTSSRSPFVGEGSSVWDIIRTHVPILNSRG
jgi:hypothetical protein